MTLNSVFVVGLGNWGTALANHLAWKGHQVLGWSVEPEIVAGVNQQHRNPNYLSHVELAKNLSATGSLADGANADLVVLVLPASALGEVVPKLTLKPGALVVSAIKGFERTTRLTPLQFCAQILGPQVPLIVLSGPSFAKDIVLRRPSGLVAASVDEKIARIVAEHFSSEWMRVYTSADPLGVELGGIVKNVIALAAGVCDGLELGESARAGLITRGLAEMTRFATALGADPRTLYGLSGLGDLTMTSTSTASRNHVVGVRLGRGESLEQILASLGSVAEGVPTARVLLDIARAHSIEMPITEAVAQLVQHQVDPREMAKRLLTRPIKSEVG